MNTPTVALPVPETPPIALLPLSLSPVAEPPPHIVPRSVERQPVVRSKPRPERRAVRVDAGGPDLPYSCSLIRWYARGKTSAQLEAEGRAHGVSLSPKQRRQAAACFTGKG